MRQTAYREISDYELAVTLKLLSAVPLGIDDSRERLPRCQVRIIAEYADNYGSIEFHPDHSLEIPRERVIIEATSRDQDAIPVLFLLHGRNHVLTELEIVKADGSRLIASPHPDTLEFSEWHPGPEPAP